MKWLRVGRMLLILLAAGLTGCASTEDIASDSSVKTQSSVPGEKTSDEPMSATAGPGGAAAGVHW
jgi:hypothetical protein